MSAGPGHGQELVSPVVRSPWLGACFARPVERGRALGRADAFLKQVSTPDLECLARRSRVHVSRGRKLRAEVVHPRCVRS
jgi:hypothetical protein